MDHINLNAEDIVYAGGAEVTLAGMSEGTRNEFGRKTLYFVRRVMQDPAMRARIQARAEEIRANGEHR